jgi:hypothetical protein
MTLTTQSGTYAGLVPQDRRRWLLWGLGAFVVLVLVALSWVSVRVAQAQHAMSHATERLVVLQRHLDTGNSTAANADVTAINADTSHARARTGGFVYSVVSGIPWVGSTPRALRSLTRSADDLAHGPLRSVLSVTTALSADQLRRPDGSVDLTAVSTAAPTLQSVEQQLEQIRTRLLHSAHGGLVLAPIDRARSATLQQIEHVASTVGVAARFAQVAPAMLGVEAPRHYLVVVQNNNQARGTGGVADNYATVVVRSGKARVTKIGLVAALPNAKEWNQANLGPDFPTAAQRWAALSSAIKPRQRFDGIIAVDPVTFQHLTGVTGPVVINTKVVATSTTIVRRAEVRYAESPRPRVRDIALAGFAKQVLTDLFTGKGKSAQLATAMGQAAGTGHLSIWSSHPDEEAVLAETSFGGVLSTAAVPFAEVVVTSTNGAKLDYFIQRSLTYFAGPCHGSTRASTITVRLDNSAPDKPPAFLSASTDRPLPGTAASQIRLSVAIYTSQGTRLSSATLDGTAIIMKQSTDHGHPVFVTPLSIDRHASRTLSLQLIEPRLGGVAVVPVQPLAQPQQTNVQALVCSTP